ncbi:MAG: 2-oxo acid dehydrogenase subunit E2 [Phycisphaerales bacterium]|nr:2-oxo acid dehydrogenase subunit E2 [Phycisphaerales bacterium]
MATKEFILPDLGEGVHEGQIVRLMVKAGERVREDQPLMEVETDKASVEIPSPFTGTIAKWHVKEGQAVKVGEVMVTIADGPADTAAEARGADERSRPAAMSTSSSSSVRNVAGNGGVAVASPPARRAPASPAVRKLARQLRLDIETIRGSGPGGRITRADVERAAAAPSASQAPTAPPPRLPSSPQSAPPRSAPFAAPAEAPGEADHDNWGPVRRQKNSMARRTIAANMVQSWSTIPHVTDSDDADVTDLDRLRRGYPSAENGQRKITMLAFVIRAVARALTLHPEFNAVFDAEHDQIIYRRYINIAVGVHTERGLITPVIRNTDQLGIMEIADALNDLAAKAREAKFTVNDTRGGTYTISNPGALGGSRYSTPIIPPGQCAVLALGRTRLMPWVVDGVLQPRLILPLSHSFDHRIADGGHEVAFMQQVIGSLENPARLLL